jgi:hypothetical protein
MKNKPNQNKKTKTKKPKQKNQNKKTKTKKPKQKNQTKRNQNVINYL